MDITDPLQESNLYWQKAKQYRDPLWRYHKLKQILNHLLQTNTYTPSDLFESKYNHIKGKKVRKLKEQYQRNLFSLITYLNQQPNQFEPQLITKRKAKV